MYESHRKKICGAFAALLLVLATACTTEAPVTTTSEQDSLNSTIAANRQRAIEATFLTLTTITGDVTDVYTDRTFTRPVSFEYACTAFFVSDHGDILSTDHCAGMQHATNLLNGTADDYPYFYKDGGADPIYPPSTDPYYADNDSESSRFLYSLPAQNVTREITAMPENTETEFFHRPTPLRYRGSIEMSGGDVALLSWDTADRPTPYLEIGNEAPQVGDPIIMTGYSIAQMNQSAPYGLRGTPLTLLLEQTPVTPMSIDGTIITRPSDFQGTVFSLTAAPAYEASSGASAIDHITGKVIGIVSSSPDSTSTYSAYGDPATPRGGNRITDLKPLQELMAQYHVTATMPDQAAPSDPTAVPAATSDESVQNSANVTNTQSDNNDLTGWIIALLVVCALLLGGNLFALLALPSQIAYWLSRQLAVNRTPNNVARDQALTQEPQEPQDRLTDRNAQD